MQDIDLRSATYMPLLNMVKIKRFGGTNFETDSDYFSSEITSLFSQTVFMTPSVNR